MASSDKADDGVFRLTASDVAAWAAMRRALFPEETVAEHSVEIGAILPDGRQAAFGARSGGEWVGFIEVGQRSYAEGCSSSPVGYIEALWVAERARRRGVARSLVESAKQWARERGFSELASDAQLANTVSHAAHRRMGFEETERIVCFRMDL